MKTRRGVPADIRELVRLRQVMIDSVHGAADPTWHANATRILQQGLADGSMVAVVVDRPGGGLAACGVGMIAQRLPSPTCLDGRFGYIQSMCTDERHRRQGLARAVFVGLMDWFREQGVVRVDLHASSMGEPLYRELGFVDPIEPELRWRAR